jgi:uncharacterized DUF497 family protein
VKEIIFSSHAENKFAILRHHGFDVSKDTILFALERPDKVEYGYKDRKIAQKVIDESHVIRVVFEETRDIVRVITFYPGRRVRYEG